MWGDYKYKILFSSLILCLIHNGNGIPRIDPLVDSKVGLIRGLRASDGDYSMFMGIPYATVDKSNPFGPATPHPAFNSIFEAYDDSAICPQIEEFNNTVVGTLDCLHVNIYAPNSADSRNRLPVAVWIYGGGFSIGFSGRYLYGPRYFVDQDIILVTLNYRLGPYGFMSLNTPDVPGNQGLKDQRLALKWIKDNIEAFGGDSDKITIFGESAGGASVDLQFLYNQEKLFDKVIMQSGTALCPWVVVEPDSSAPLKLSEHLGFKTSNAEEALAFLATVDTNLLIAATSDLGLMFRPTVENGFDSDDKFIYDYPINVKKTNLRNVPILLGYNSDEQLIKYETLSPADFAKLDLFNNHLQYFNIDDESLVEMEALVRHFYIGDEEISENVKNELIKFDSDFWFNHPVHRTIQKYLDGGARNIYQYVFSYDGKRNFVKDRLNVTAAGAAHADEIGYFFDISYMGPPSWEDQVIIDRVTTLWANFVKFGNPTPVSTELLPVQWPPVTKEALNYLNIDLDLKVEKRHYKSRMAFWDLFLKLNENAQIGYEESSK
ncbi:bile salt-activated lipase [Spodoptera frugiperda]|uniref:Carboxylic ester hydrolase n=1 Tax=Spodoptera frugiperda TaxID=7108 RepID=A0A9R0DEZ4_SPOFR|nr:bile salt-activated lipase [Spodoptera frugiperda]